MMYLFLDYLEVLLVALLICIFCDVEQKNRYCLISSVISFLDYGIYAKLIDLLAMKWHMQ